MKQKPYPERHRRKKNIIPTRKMYLIFTEGHTERAYLSHFQTSTKLHINVNNPSVNKQLGLVQALIARRDELVTDKSFVIGRDEAWAVFDRDIEKSNPKDADNFARAIALAKKEGIEIALSNDSFEVWYLMHFQEVSGAPMHRRVLEQKLTEHLKRQYKSRKASQIEDLYYEIRDLRPYALAQAKRLNARCKKDGLKTESLNPLTSINVLIERIMGEKGFKEG